MTKKQNEWSARKVRRAINSKLLKFTMFVSILFLAVGYLSAQNDYTLDDFGLSMGMAGGSTGSLMYVVVLGNPVNTYKAGKIVKANIYVLAAEDYDDSQSFPSKVDGERGNIPILAGTYWKKIEAILDSPEPKWNGSVGDVAAIIKNSISFILGGMDKTVFDWLESRISLGHYVVFEICLETETKRYLIGNGCKPAKMMTFEGGSTKDYTGTTVTFEQECGELITEYVGNTPVQDPAAVLASATTIALTSNDRYLIASGTASTEITAFTGTSTSDENRVVTVMGGGGVGPSKIVDGSGFVLVGGEDWVGDANTQISFKIFRDGASTYKYIEIAGSRT